jgi:4'-phosphopantetheinyl transferase EntD
MNPATLSAELAQLFPSGTVAAVLRGPGDVDLLLPAEAAHLGRAVPQRAREFAAARLCARRALAEFGMAEFPVKVAADRQPIWPATMVGSITHTEGFCAAVVAQRSVAISLGLDTERTGHVNPEIWPVICVSDETEWLASLPAPQRAAAATLIFAAKEAFYKFQYPLVQERLHFRDARVCVEDWGAAKGQFEIRATRPIAAAAHVTPGHFRAIYFPRRVRHGRRGRGLHRCGRPRHCRLSRPYRREIP